MMPHARLQRKKSRDAEREHMPVFTAEPIATQLALPAPALQPKLTISQPDDNYEQEAERVSGQIMCMPASEAAIQRSPIEVQRCAKCGGEEHETGGALCAECEAKATEEGSLQRYASDAALLVAQEIENSIASIRGGGQPLDAATRAFMEPRFGHDFSQVRVHTSAEAAEAARSVNAWAYTLGSDVVFGAGQYQPSSDAGRRLLAHELTHVVQQGNSDATTSNPYEAVEAVATRDTIARLSSQPTTMLHRDDTISTADLERRADQAELMCDLRTLCEMRFSAPTIVPLTRVRSVYNRCLPGSDSSLVIDPCLRLDLSQQGISSQPAQRSTTRGLGNSTPTLSDLLSFQFSVGPIQFNTTLPESVAARLPIPLSNAASLVFALQAEASGEFSFSITLNNLLQPYVRVEAKAQLKVDKEKGTSGSVGLEVTANRTVCHADNSDSLRSKIIASGDMLKKAMQELETAESSDRLFKLADIADAMSQMYSVVEESKQGCKQVPAASLSMGLQGPISPNDTALSDPDPTKRPSTSIGVMFTVPF